MAEKGFPNISVIAVFRVAVVALLVLACVRVIQPFLGALAWAAIIAISAWPLFTRLRQYFNGRGRLAALLVVSALALALAIPLGLMALTLADTIPHLSRLAYDLTNFKLPDAPHWLGTIPIAGPSLQKFWQGTQSDLPGFIDRIRPTINSTALWALQQGASMGISLMEIVLAIVIAGLLLVNGDALWDAADHAIVKLGGAPAGDVSEVIARTVRSVTTGIVGTALAQTLLCVIGLLIAGVPGAITLGFLCFVIAVAQLPTLLVWLPAALWVLYIGETGLGVFLMLWGFLLVNTIDNFLKPMLISQGAQMPLSLIFMGVIGGLLAWGMLGLFIGPTLLAVGLNLYRHWLELDENASEPPASIPTPPNN